MVLPDPSLVVLLAGAAAASVQLVRWVTGSRGRVVFSWRSNEDCIAGVIVEDLACVYENLDAFRSVLERVLVFEDVVGVVIAKRNVEKSRVLSRIENRMMTLRVLLEKEAGNVSLERRLEVLKLMYERVSNAKQPVESVFEVVVAGDCSSLGRIAALIRQLGCRVRIIRGLDALKVPVALRRGSIGEESLLSELALRAIGESSSREGVYIGVDAAGRPFFLPLRGREGSFHYVVVGPTGRGKTTLAAILLVRSAALGVRVYGVDPKGDLARYTEPYLRVERVGIEDALNALFWLYREGMVSKRFVENTLLELNLDEMDWEAIVESCGDNGLPQRVKKRLASLGVTRLDPCREPVIASLEGVVDVSLLPEGLKASLTALLATSALRRGGLLVVDEAWRLARILSYHVVRLYKEARSAGLSIIALTQDPSDLPHEVFNNSRGVIIFGSSDEEYIRSVARSTGLSGEEARALRGLGVGRALVKLWGSRPIVVEIDASELLNDGLKRLGVSAVAGGESG